MYWFYDDVFFYVPTYTLFNIYRLRNTLIFKIIDCHNYG